jgi:predicted DNA-binding transcriptional regulator AlpA
LQDELDELLRQPAVLKAKGGSAAKLWEDVRNGTFPKPVKAGPKITAWFKSEVLALLLVHQFARPGR